MIVNIEEIKEVTYGDYIYLITKDNYEIMLTRNRRPDEMAMHWSIEVEIYHKEDEDRKLLRTYYYDNSKIEVYHDEEEAGTCYIIKKSEKELYIGTRFLSYTLAFLKDIGGIVNTEIKKLDRKTIFREMFVLK